MKRISFFAACLCASSCISGCVVNPMPASKLFGTSNPTLKAKVTGYGALEIPTNFDGDVTFAKNPDGSVSLHANVKSNAAVVVDSEGNRIPNMEVQRIADENRAIAQEQIRSAERVELYRMAASGLPMLAQMVGQRNARQPEGNTLSPQDFDSIRFEIDTKLRAMGMVPPR